MTIFEALYLTDSVWKYAEWDAFKSDQVETPQIDMGHSEQKCPNSAYGSAEKFFLFEI